MNKIDLPSIEEFVELVRMTDEDADHRLTILKQATPVLFSGARISHAEREALADKFERWRYQRLNKYRAGHSTEDRRLIDVLDLAFNKLWGGEARAPRSPRIALVDDSFARRLIQRTNSSSFAEIGIVPDHDTSLEQIVPTVTELTLRHFRLKRSDKPKAHTHDHRSAASETTTRWRMRLYAPLYLSNHCVNHCLYCAFRYPNQIDRAHLGVDEAIAEANILRSQGHEHLLIVAGEFPKLTTTDYLVTMIRELVGMGFNVSVEAAPQSTLSYAEMVRAGACGVTLYQETYQEGLYNQLHPRGPKRWFDWRLEALERAIEAGMKRIGLGILVGLADPALDLRCLIRHGRYLLDRFSDVNLAFSLPRIHEAPDSYKSNFPVDDETFIRLYCALRFSFPNADLILSTRESPALRDELAGICITQMSAGSCTSPGGYGRAEDGETSGEQFPVFDHRTTPQLADELTSRGFELSWGVTDP